MGQIGRSADKAVFLGFASSSLLSALSFADVLDEDTGLGYQRRFNAQHSLDFRKYIQRERSTTIPLTFNLRPCTDEAWMIQQDSPTTAVLVIKKDAGKIMAQVDCQHRLGHLNDIDITLPFMCFIGLSASEEMEIFNVINSKARGLSTSLLDFHDATLSKDLGGERPELFIALHLNTNKKSPWYRQLDLGGTTTSGLKRRASLRTMQKAIRRFLNHTKILRSSSPEVVAQIVVDYWCAVRGALKGAWDKPRHYLINKGIGVYALMTIAGDLYLESAGTICDEVYFTHKLRDFIQEIDWTSNGLLRGLGGEGGVKTAVSLIREKRQRIPLRVISNG